MSTLFSWVQPHYRQGSKARANYYLPYSAGILWNYIQKFPNLAAEYSLGEVIWKRDPIDDVVNKLKNSNIVGFSTYVWNKSYNYEVAKRLKQVNPDCYIIFGGPETPHTRDDVFTTLPFIDCIVKKEGEMVLKDILEKFGNRDELKTVLGIVLNVDGTRLDTGESARIDNLDEVPSPYLTGFFDKIIADNPKLNWSVVFEPDRGCPYQCTYCDWGSMTYAKIKKFELQRLFDELEWFGKNKIRMIMVANANFGIFPERDHMIADKILEVRATYGYPVSMYASWAKNQKREVINIAKKLHDLTGLTVSIQTMTSEVLTNIKRSNLPINNTKEIFQLCHLENIPVHTELILGLPGESLQSWKDTVYQVFEAGNHTSISFYTAQILENSEMNLLQRKLYGIKSIPVKDFMAGAEMDEEISETVNVVVATKHLPVEDMISALMFNMYINTFHVTGISTFVSRFIRKYKGESYDNFYTKFYDFMMEDPWFAAEIEETRSYYEKWAIDGEIRHPLIGETIEINGLNLHYRMAIKIYHNRDMLRPHIMNLLRKFVDQTYAIDPDIADELFKLQELYFIDFSEVTSYPKQISFSYDFVNYLLVDSKLENPVEYLFEYRGNLTESLELFCELIYYSRRGQLTKSRITTIGQAGEFEY